MAFVLVGIVLLAAAVWLPRPFRLSDPVLAHAPDHVTVSSTAFNNTDRPVTAKIRVRVFDQRIPNKVNSAVFRERDHRDVSVIIGPRSNEQVTATFPASEAPFIRRAEFEVLDRR